MSKTVKSMRGEDVDFDLFKVKEEIAKSEEAAANTQARERFIENLKRRNPRKRNNKNRSVAETLKEQERLAMDIKRRLQAADKPDVVSASAQALPVAEEVEAAPTEEKKTKKTPTQRIKKKT